MRKTLTVTILVLTFLFANKGVFAQTSSLSGTLDTEVVAQVGEFYLNLSGYASAFASIVLTSNGSFMASTVADANANFSFSRLLIKRGFSDFCFDTIDFKRLGESTACISIPPVTDSVTMKEIFLPPTLGLSSTTTDFNSTVFSFGYTLPGSKVTLYLSNPTGKISFLIPRAMAAENSLKIGNKLVAVADAKGYYFIKISRLEPGNYGLYAKADYKDKKSLNPTKKARLRSLSIAERVKEGLEGFVEKAKELFTSTTFWFILVAIALIILIIILLIKLRSRLKKRFIPSSKPESSISHGIPDNRKLLHHWWWVGY